MPTAAALLGPRLFFARHSSVSWPGGMYAAAAQMSVTPSLSLKSCRVASSLSVVRSFSTVYP